MPPILKPQNSPPCELHVRLRLFVDGQEVPVRSQICIQVEGLDGNESFGAGELALVKTITAQGELEEQVLDGEIFAHSWSEWRQLCDWPRCWHCNEPVYDLRNPGIRSSLTVARQLSCHRCLQGRLPEEAMHGG